MRKQQESFLDQIRGDGQGITADILKQDVAANMVWDRHGDRFDHSGVTFVGAKTLRLVAVPRKRWITNLRPP